MSDTLNTVTQYRGGLIVPDIDVGMRTQPRYNLKTFFDDVFAANGEGWPMHEGVTDPKAYLNEIVVPGSEEKPLVVIRDNFVPIAGTHWPLGRHSEVVTYATNEKSILVAPDAGSLIWKGLVNYRDYYRRGDNGHMYSYEELGTDISFYDNNKVNRKASKKYESEERMAVWNNAIKKALDQFVELVSE